MTTHPEFADIYEFLEYQLPIFDETFADQSVPLKDRPDAAVALFVDFCIIETKGCDKKDILKMSWFSAVVEKIERWYIERYGAAMKSKISQDSRGLVLIYNTPFEFIVPFMLAGEMDGPNRRWFHFSNDRLKDQNIMTWFQSPPNLSKIDKEALVAIREDMVDVASDTRTIHINLLTADLNQTELRRARSIILDNLTRAVRDIASLEESRVSTAYWEMHFALEQALKLIIAQYGLSIPRHHDLAALANTINEETEKSIDGDTIRLFSCHKKAIKHRYGEAPPMSIREAHLNYRNMLVSLRNVSTALKRRFVVNNGSILLQPPPWKRKLPPLSSE